MRVISATNRNLEADVKAGRFREDLFFRLNVLHLELPALRERRQDIAALTRHFIDRFCASDGKALRDISEPAIKKLCAYDWPGNIRQLENTLNRAMVMGDGDIEEDDLMFASSFSESNKPLPYVSSQGSFQLYNSAGHLKTMKEIESDAMAHALEKFGGNITQAAKALNIAKSTFYRKIKE